MDVTEPSVIGGIDRFAQQQALTKLDTGYNFYDVVRAWAHCKFIESVQAGSESVVHVAGRWNRA